MSLRQRSGSVPCLYCGKLVGVDDGSCWSCGGRSPSLWGYSRSLRRLASERAFVVLVIGACGFLYLASLALSAIGGFPASPRGGYLQVLAPSSQVLFLLGATGSIPVFEYDRWWTVLSSAWLHGGLLHIVFNMLWINMLAPTVARAFGVGRMVIIYMVAAICGGLATTLVSAFFPDLPGPLRGAGLSIGASGAVFGLLGAVVLFGRKVGGQAGQQAWTLAAVLFVFGLIMPGIDNWGHLGGFIGGFAAAAVMNARRPERGYHLLAALGFLVLSALSIIASVVHGLGPAFWS